MAVSNTIAYYNKVTIMDAKGFIVQAASLIFVGKDRRLPLGESPIIGFTLIGFSCA
jgi:hypothetical protein